MRLTRTRIVAISCGGLLALSLVPVPYLASPDWEVWVVDQGGNPVHGIVRLEYENYSVEATGHEEDLVTDDAGYAHFQPHRASASFLRRCFYTASSAAALAHASFGPHDYVLAFGNGLEGDAVTNGYVTDWTGEPDHMKSTIKVRPSNR